jgi:hypothetical protein
VPEKLLPRLTGFELMMAPYAIAHMKIGLKLLETGYTFGSNERARVFLTNALEKPRDVSAEFSFIAEALAHEARASNTAKSECCFTAIIGNPPYANYSSNLSEEARKIVDQYRNFRGEKIRERNQLQFERNIQDDYVKFFSICQGYIDRASYGVLGLITNATMLSSRSLKGMRESLTNTFDKIRELNLHGGVNERVSSEHIDENVFEISQSVAIHIYSRYKKTKAKKVSYLSMRGNREEKYETLLRLNLSSSDWSNFQPDVEILAFSEPDKCRLEQVIRYDDVFETFGAGIKTNNDSVVIGFDDLNLSERLAKAGVESDTSYFCQLLYRPLDIRRVYYRKGHVKSMSKPTMQHMTCSPNTALLASSTWTTPDRFSVEACSTMAEMKSGTHDRGTTLFPLYRFEGLLGGAKERVCNFKPSFLKAWYEAVGQTISDQKTPKEDNVQALQVLDWMYALTFSVGYRQRYKASLATGFPIVLLPNSMEIFVKVRAFGEELRLLHDPLSPEFMDGSDLEIHKVHIAGYGNRQVARGFPTYENGKVHINSTRWFEDVPRAVWEFSFGGYQVCEKWLKDRAGKGGKNPSDGRLLTDADVLHYRKIISVVMRTRQVIDEIDTVINQYGGWPDAFYVPPPPPPTIGEILQIDEGHEVEYKSTFQWDLKDGKKNKDLQKSTLKTLAAFMNSDGGTLVIGVTDEKQVHGLDDDMALTKNSVDVFEQNLLTVFGNTIGTAYAHYCKIRIVDATDGKKVCVIDVEQSTRPVFLTFQGKEDFFIRRGNATISLSPQEQHVYVGQRFS